MDKQKKRVGGLVAGVAAAVVILAVVLILLLPRCSGEAPSATTGTTAATEAVSDNAYTLYWNLDRAEYDGKSEGGMSSREMEDDGLFHIRMFCDGQELILKTASRKVVNELDTEDLMGLVFDEEGLIADVLPLEQMPLEEVARKFYVQSVGGKLIKANSSESFVGMEVLLECDQAHVYDMSGIAGPVGAERVPTDLTAYDRILAIRNLDGVVTHVFVYERPNYMLTHEGECIHCKESVTWFEWVKEDELPVKNGHYQLMVDIQLKGQMSMPTDAKTCLDLNGHTVEGKQDTRLYSIHNAGCEFALMDTSEAQTGKMVGHSTASPQGGIVWVRYGQFHLYSGTLDGSDMISKLNGTVVQVPKNAYFYMHGGTIIGGTAAPQYNNVTKAYTYGLGGSVQVAGIMRMYGGTITGGSAPAAYYYKDGKLTLARGMGGNIFLSTGAVLEIQGGLIQYGHAGNVGGNIMMDGTAELIISGGKISGGWTDDKIAGKNGANVYCPSKGTITMSGGSIEGGHCNSGSGGNIHLAGTMLMTGGNVFGGVAKQSGGNIYMATNAKLTMYAGSIRGGVANGTASGHGGGNIHVAGDGAVLSLHGGYIYKGTANGFVNADGITSGGDGGNVNLNRGTMIMDGGMVMEGKGNGNGGGIYVGWNSKGLHLADDAKIYDNEGTDVCRSANTAAGKSQIVLKDWKGNGDKNALVINRLSATAGSILAQPEKGTELTKEDVAKFRSTHLVLPIALSKDGNLILSETATLGEGDHFHCVCGGKLKGTAGHTCKDVGFVSVTAEQFSQCWIESDGTYNLAGTLSLCLTEDLTLSTEYKLNGYVLNLCLNGHTVTMEGNGRITANGTSGVLNLTDCGDGSIVAAEGCRSSILYAYKGEVNVYGGTVDASKCTSGKGGTLRMGFDGDKFTLYGGKLIGSQKATIGGTIYIEKKGIATIAGGEVLNGVATDAGGGNIYVGAGQLIISGGKIAGGKATGTASTKGLGGNIHAIDGTITITGGTITGGEASGFASAADTKAMSGGIYTGYNQDGISLSGNAKIYGNKGSDIWLTSNTKINLVLDQWNGNGGSGALKIGRLGGKDGTILAEGTVAKADLEKFTSAHTGLELKLISGKMVLKAPLVHEHCICGGKLTGHSCANVKFTEVEDTSDFTKLFNSDKSLIASANIVLTGDVALDDEYKMAGKTLNICLNGHTITMSGKGRITANGNGGLLNITDCTGNGKVAAAAGCRSGILYTYNGKINVYSGTVDASKCAAGNGGAVIVGSNNDSFSLYGGTIVGSQAAENGGAIYTTAKITGATVNINGGTVRGGKAASGGNIYITTGTLNLNGGIVTGGEATDGSGGIYMAWNAAAVNLNGNTKVYGNNGSDIFLGSNTTNVVTLGNWAGNGASGTLVITKLNGVEDNVIMKPASGTEINAAKLGFFTYSDDTMEMVLSSGNVVLKERIFHKHCVCNAAVDGHSCTQITYTEIASADDFKALFSNNELKANASVYLAANISLDAEYKLAGKTLNLCLNGYTLTMTGNARITANGSGVLNLTACGNGKIAAASGCRTALLYTYGGKIHVYSGTVDASNCAAGNGGAIYVNSANDELHIYGGKIIGSKKGVNGGTIYCGGSDAKVNIYGGEINGGVANKTKDTGDGLGGNIHMVKGTLNITGGIITGGSANGKANANAPAGLTGGIYIPYNGTVNLSGNAKIYGNAGSDIYLTSRTDVKVFKLGAWNGNGSNGALKIAKLDAVEGVQLIAPASGSLSAADAAKFVYAVEGHELYVDSNGGISLDKLHYHCVCSGKVSGHSCSKLTWTEVNAAQFLALFDSSNTLSADANVVLTEDVTLAVEYKMGGKTMNLCLNGHTITMKTNGRMTANGNMGTLNITDCGTTGNITADANCRHSILYTYKGNLNLYGGKVNASACKAPTKDTEGGALTVGFAGDTFTMYGGTILGSQKGTCGGSINSVASTTILVKGGTISGGKATKQGGNIYVVNGILTISGGEITGGEAAGSGGGNIYISNGTLTISGGKIAGGKATGTAADKGMGGNIHGIKGTMNITGGEITGGIASGKTSNAADTPLMSGGIYVGYNYSAINLSGNAKVYGNTGADFWLSSNKNFALTLGDWAGNGTNGVLKLGKSAGAEGATLAKPAADITIDDATLAKFTCAHSGMVLAISDGNIVLAK